MILSIGQVAGALAILAGTYLLFGIPVALVVAGTVVLVVCTLAELAGTPRVAAVKARDAQQPGGM